MRLLKILAVLTIALALSVGAYAETQSVKVSGAITERAFARCNYDLKNHEARTAQTSNDWATFLQSTAEVQVDADLTDNVGGVIRLVNQRVWGDNVYLDDGQMCQIGPEGTLMSRTVGYTTTDTNADSFAVDVALAYIELKQFLYSPLTLRIGRQDLWFGKGFIIGANLTQFRNDIYAAEYTAIRSFDAIRATLDYDPLTIDAVYAKITENGMRKDDDVNLWGVNAGYVFDKYNADAEGYFWWKQDRNTGSPAGTSIGSVNGITSNNIYVLGTRGSIDPIENWTVSAEGAYQFGQFLGADYQNTTRQRSAWAVDASLECRYWKDKYAWKPVVAIEYILYSGETDASDDNNAFASGTYTGWDVMYRGKFDTAIREWQNVFYRTLQASSPACTNQQQLLLKGSIEPTDSLTINATYGHFWLCERYAGVTPNKNIGDELDFNLTWDYTEDVSFGLLAGWFFPGNHWANGNSDVAADVVGTVKLSF
ncbi:MAG: alginate export family protein [Candidatus Omnitrophica bacterium]|nr:alginate export family protein [Candidatus Omnitrophota bacterium]